MRSRSLSPHHDAAVARRLELLTTELAAVRGDELGADQGPAFVDVPELGGPASALHDVTGPRPSVARAPGRHASRRGVVPGPVSRLLPEGVRGQVALAPGQLAVVAVLAVVGLALTCWWLVRGGGHEVAAPAALSTPAALVTPGSGPAGVGMAGASSGSLPAHALASGPSADASAEVVVDVTGKVRHPGIAVLSQGARVIDAVRAAGGARRGVGLGGLNLARVLIDGEQIVVGSASSPGSAPVPVSGSGAPSSGLVDINTADETALESLPEVGPVTAQAILTWRTQHGGFTSVDQLLDVDGIGDATLAKLKPYVTV